LRCWPPPRYHGVLCNRRLLPDIGASCEPLHIAADEPKLCILLKIVYLYKVNYFEMSEFG
jgi:hypothetical protein